MRRCCSLQNTLAWLEPQIMMNVHTLHRTCQGFVATTANHCNMPLRMKIRLLIWSLQVITISGRTIRKEAQASPKYAEAAISAIEKLLAACPQQDLDQAQNMRKSRLNVKAV